MGCDHSAPHSGASRYESAAAQLYLVVVCDRCGAERRELASFSYRPRARRYAGHLVELTARELGLSELQIDRVRLAAMICDAARDQISQEILAKHGPLTPEEWVEVRRQPELAAALLSDASFEDIKEWVLCLRERPDGSGYPRGLRSEEIPLEARILSVVEAYVAMLSDRPHRAAYDHDHALRELLLCAGSQFDARVVHAFERASLRRSSRLASLPV
jgi:HD-GYP domain-containing protein (c-di-GMP phosphodiesterase class II)